MSGANAHAYINFPAELEDIYNLHSAVLYGIAVEIKANQSAKVDVILMGARVDFRNHRQKSNQTSNVKRREIKD